RSYERITGLRKETRSEHAVEQDGHAGRCQSTQVSGPFAYLRPRLRYRSQRGVDRKGAQRRFDRAYAVCRRSESFTTDAIAQVVTLKGLWQPRFTAQHAAYQYRAEIGLSHESGNGLAMMRRGLGQQLVDQGPHELWGWAAEIDLLYRTGRKRTVDRSSYSSACGRSCQAYEVQRGCRRGLRTCGREQVDELRTVVRVVHNEDDALQLRQLLQFFLHHPVVMADEQHLPTPAFAFHSLRKLQREPALAAARRGRDDGWAAPRRHRIHQLDLASGIADVRSIVSDQSLVGIRAQIGGVISLPAYEGSPRKLPGKLTLRPTPDRAQEVEAVQAELALDHALLGRLVLRRPAFSLLCQYDSHAAHRARLAKESREAASSACIAVQLPNDDGSVM